MRTGIMGACFIALLTSGCDDIPQARSKTDIQRIAAETSAGELSRLETQLMAAQARIQKLEEDNERQDTFALGTYNSLNSLRNTFNGNVDRANAAKVAAMTARGACGEERYYDDAGYPRLRNKPCTLKDLL